VTLTPFEPVDARTIALDRVAVPAAQVVAGTPATGIATLGGFAGARLGVWEMTAGGMRDTEVDEVFVVIDGEAEVVMHDRGSEVARIALTPGTVVRLAAGSTTEWIVPDRVRKVYLAV
jgi:uncharacterized protein